MNFFASTLTIASLTVAAALPLQAQTQTDPMFVSCTDFLAMTDEVVTNFTVEYDIALETQGKSDAEVAALKAAIEAETEEQKGARMTAMQERIAAMRLACEANPSKSVAEANKRS